MKTNTTTPDYKGYRFPPAIISHAVWLYFRFSLSFRDIEERTTHNAESSSPTKRSVSGR
jgi:transposase-like protein